MATLLHHIQPWMQRSIAEAEERLEWRMVQHKERKIAEVHPRLYAFELRVLAQPAPPVDVSTLQAAVDSLRADIDMILEARVLGSETPSVDPAEAQCWRPYSPAQRFHHLPLGSMPRGVGVKTRMKLEHRIRSAVRWRLRGEPLLLRRRRSDESRKVSCWGV